MNAERFDQRDEEKGPIFIACWGSSGACVANPIRIELMKSTNHDDQLLKSQISLVKSTRH